MVKTYMGVIMESCQNIRGLVGFIILFASIAGEGS